MAQIPLRFAFVDVVAKFAVKSRRTIARHATFRQRTTTSAVLADVSSGISVNTFVNIITIASSLPALIHRSLTKFAGEIPRTLANDAMLHPRTGEDDPFGGCGRRLRRIDDQLGGAGVARRRRVAAGVRRARIEVGKVDEVIGFDNGNDVVDASFQFEFRQEVVGGEFVFGREENGESIVIDIFVDSQNMQIMMFRRQFLIHRLHEIFEEARVENGSRRCGRQTQIDDDALQKRGRPEVIDAVIEELDGDRIFDARMHSVGCGNEKGDWRRGGRGGGRGGGC